MADYRQIHTKIWKDNWFLDLDPQEKVLFIYLFSNEQASIAGIYELPMRVIVFETGLDKGVVTAAMRGFQEAGKVYYADGVVWVANLRKYNENASPKVLARIKKDVEAVPDGEVKRRYLAFYQPKVKVDTVSIPYPEFDAEQDTEQEKETKTPLPPNGGTSVSKTQTLVSHFSNKSKINPPNGKQKVAWREGWIEPLNEILDLTADDVTAACALIDRALAHMRQNDLTIARPSSISSVVKMLHAKTSNGAATGDIWQGLLRQMSAVGARGSPQVDETTGLVIRACGGWQNLCQMDVREAERVFKSKYKQVAA